MMGFLELEDTGIVVIYYCMNSDYSISANLGGASTNYDMYDSVT